MSASVVGGGSSDVVVVVVVVLQLAFSWRCRKKSLAKLQTAVFHERPDERGEATEGKEENEPRKTAAAAQ
jgi:hypothetical protein